jgi:hypothetical protein
LLVRVRVETRKQQRLLEINLRRVQAQSWWWNDLMPDGFPLVLRDQSSEEIYALDSQLP